MISPVAGPQTMKFKYGQATAPDLNIKLICPNCREDPPNFIEEYAKGDIVCTTCGTILGDRIVDTRSEWRTFAGDENGDDPSRVGDASNPLLGEDLVTRIGGDGKNGIAQSLNRAAARQFAKDKTNKSLNAAFAKITELGAKMQLTQNVINQAQWAFKTAEEAQATRTKEIDSIIAACIILGCRNARVDRSLLEVAKITGTSKKKIGQMLLKLNPIVKEALGDQNSSNVLSSGEQSIRSLLARYVNFLGVSNEIMKAANFVAEKAGNQEGIVGRSPVSIAAGVLWFTLVLFDRKDDLERSPCREIAVVAQVSEGTIKHVQKLIATKISAVIKPEWTSLGGYAALYQQGNNDRSNKPSRSGSPRAGSPKVEPQPDTNGTKKEATATP